MANAEMTLSLPKNCERCCKILGVCTRSRSHSPIFRIRSTASARPNRHDVRRRARCRDGAKLRRSAGPRRWLDDHADGADLPGTLQPLLGRVVQEAQRIAGGGQRADVDCPRVSIQRESFSFSGCFLELSRTRHGRSSSSTASFSSSLSLVSFSSQQCMHCGLI